MGLRAFQARLFGLSSTSPVLSLPNAIVSSHEAAASQSGDGNVVLCKSSLLDQICACVLA
jgi:hypothetical protein